MATSLISERNKQETCDKLGGVNCESTSRPVILILIFVTELSNTVEFSADLILNIIEFLGLFQVSFLFATKMDLTMENPGVLINSESSGHINNQVPDDHLLIEGSGHTGRYLRSCHFISKLLANFFLETHNENIRKINLSS